MPTVKRAPDFAGLGEYEVTLDNGQRKLIFRDPESRSWYETGNGLHYSQNYLGETKAEALRSLQQKYDRQ